MSDSRPRFAAADKSKGTSEEYKAAVQGSNCHFGRSIVNDADHIRVHAGQLKDYLRATGVPRGQLVYMTPGLWVASRPAGCGEVLDGHAQRMSSEDPGAAGGPNTKRRALCDHGQVRWPVGAGQGRQPPQPGAEARHFWTVRGANRRDEPVTEARPVVERIANAGIGLRVLQPAGLLELGEGKVDLLDAAARQQSGELSSAGRGPVLNRASMLIDAAIDGQGVALARTTLAAWDLISGRIVRPFDLSWRPAGTYWIMSPRATAKVEKVSRFRDWLLGEAADDVRRLKNPAR
jgi:hypothetical protein